MDHSVMIKLSYKGESKLLEVNGSSLFTDVENHILGFKNCQPMLFLDETFMKGRAKGLFHVAFAVVSTDNMDSWAWFLRKLCDCVKHVNTVFYISDQNYGLLSAFSLVFYEPVHIYCLFHLITNLKGHFSGGWNYTQ
ncbi:hypothetical protein ACS0TY_004087 [Phlomoides rotata]